MRAGGESSIELPESIRLLLLEIVDAMLRGDTISLVPKFQDLTTQQGAELLGVSRPYFVKLLESGALPFHSAGTHRRVYLKDLLAYKNQRDQDRHKALDQMGQDAEDAGVYDVVVLPEEA